MKKCKIADCSGKARTKGLCVKHAQRLRYTGTTDPGPRAHAPPEVRFWRHVKRSGEFECWPWIGGGRTAGGYGLLSIGGKNGSVVSAHRFSYELHVAPIPNNMIVMHTCDNPRCVNPAHLQLGTYQDNAQDMIRKGRHARKAPKGEASGVAKLTDERVRFIRANPQMGHKEIADLWGVSPNAIRGVRIGRTWTHIK